MTRVPRYDLNQAASNMTRYHKPLQTCLNNRRTPDIVTAGSLVYAHQPDPANGKFSHEWRHLRGENGFHNVILFRRQIFLLSTSNSGST
jgi:hypothetical protein